MPAAAIVSALARIAAAAAARGATGSAASAAARAAGGVGQVASGSAASAARAAALREGVSAASNFVSGTPPRRAEVDSAARSQRLREWAADVPHAAPRQRDTQNVEQVAGGFKQLFAVTTGLAGTFVLLGKKVADAANEYSVANAAKYAPYSGSIANAYSRLTFQEHALNMQTARNTSGSATAAAETARWSNEAWQPMRELWTDTKNYLATLVNIASTVMGYTAYMVSGAWVKDLANAIFGGDDKQDAAPWEKLLDDMSSGALSRPNVPRPGRK